MDNQNAKNKYWYGLRYGTNTPKASGFFGELKVPGTNDLATEYSADVNIDGKNVQIPTITPNLKANQLARLLYSMGSNSDIPNDVMNSAIEHARLRSLMGQSPFWRMPEKVQSLPKINAFDVPMEYGNENFLRLLLNK